jgi:hypothetical protein
MERWQFGSLRRLEWRRLGPFRRMERKQRWIGPQLLGWRREQRWLERWRRWWRLEWRGPQRRIEQLIEWIFVEQLFRRLVGKQ